MKALRMTASLLVAFVMAATMLASSPANPAWDRLKSLVGEWEGTENGKSFHVSFRLISGGTALMETLNGPDAMEMVTVYHPDRDSILMTHYCVMGNQPRMRAKALENGKREPGREPLGQLRRASSRRRGPVDMELQIRPLAASRRRAPRTMWSPRLARRVGR